jgi:hypothetical protein
VSLPGQINSRRDGGLLCVLGGCPSTRTVAHLKAGVVHDLSDLDKFDPGRHAVEARHSLSQLIGEKPLGRLS